MKLPRKIKHRIVLVEDHPLTRAGLRAFLDSCDDLLVCSEADTAGRALDDTIKWSPDLVISDIGLPGRSGLERLLKAIQNVLQGRISVSPAMSHRLLEFLASPSKNRRSGVETMSPREFKVFQLLGDGLDIATIAARLHISTKTVDTHRERIKHKLHVESLSKLIAMSSHWKATRTLPA